MNEIKTFLYIQKPPSSEGIEARNTYTASPRRQCDQGNSTKSAVGLVPLLAHFSGELSFTVCNQELPLALLEVTLFSIFNLVYF